MEQFNLTTLKNDIGVWVTDWVSVYNPALEAVPCPFAKQAIADDKIVYCYCNTQEEISKSLIDLAINGFDKNKEVLVIGINPSQISVDDFQLLTADANSTYLSDAGFVALEDHPHDIELVNNEPMNQGRWALLLVQAKSKLDKASAMLEKQGYYKKWSQENLNDVVEWRKTS
jgi:hypothetical protein